MGKHHTTLLRKTKNIPCVVYGKEKNSILHVYIQEHDFNIKLNKCMYNTKIVLKISDNESYDVRLHQIEYDKITDKIIHLDFLFINIKSDSITCPIPIKFINSQLSPGIKRGGFLNIISRSYLTKCDMNNIPENLLVDLS